MSIKSGSIFTDNGVKITLADLLNNIPENDWMWQLFEFEGVGIAPQGMNMPDFEDLVATEQYGFFFTWEELKSFANTVADVKSCVVAAAGKPIEYESLENGHESGVIALVGVYDSTDWEIKLFG